MAMSVIPFTKGDPTLTTRDAEAKVKEAVAERYTIVCCGYALRKYPDRPIREILAETATKHGAEKVHILDARRLGGYIKATTIGVVFSVPNGSQRTIWLDVISAEDTGSCPSINSRMV
jgi:hypothetical protein